MFVLHWIFDLLAPRRRRRRGLFALALLGGLALLLAPSGPALAHGHGVAVVGHVGAGFYGHHAAVQLVTPFFSTVTAYGYPAAAVALPTATYGYAATGYAAPACQQLPPAPPPPVQTPRLADPLPPPPPPPAPPAPPVPVPVPAPAPAPCATANYGAGYGAGYGAAVGVGNYGVGVALATPFYGVGHAFTAVNHHVGFARHFGVFNRFAAVNRVAVVRQRAVQVQAAAPAVVVNVNAARGRRR